MKYLAAIALIFTVGLAAAGCASSPGGPSPAAYAAVQMPSYTPRAQEYRIRPGDQLDIKFFYNPELNEQVTVRPDGRISLQLVHEIIAAGLTPAKLTELLTKDYAPKLAKPEITVIVRSFVGQRVFVDGEVNRPGMLNLIAPMTVLQSLSEAGGVKDTAKRDQILIIRRYEKKPLVLTVNIKKVIDGTARDLSLLPNDIIYVPKSRIADVNLWVDQYIRKNIPINVGAGIFYNYPNNYH